MEFSETVDQRSDFITFFKMILIQDYCILSIDGVADESLKV